MSLRRAADALGFVLLVFAAASAVHAQSWTSSSPPRGLVGAGIAFAEADAGDRMRLGREADTLVWLIEAAVAVAPRVSIGGEFVDLGEATGSTSGRSFTSTGVQSERVLTGVLRVRVWAGSRAAVDLDGGAGVLFQRHEQWFAPCSSGCEVSFRESISRRAPAGVAGLDVPVRLARHVSIAGFVRGYVLRREEVVSTPEASAPWQYETRPSARLSAGASVRATW